MAYLDEDGLEYVLSKLATEGKAKNADHATTAGTASSCSGNAATATTATTATTANKTAGTLTIQGNGTTLTNGTYNGSANKTVNITPGNIGAYTKSEIDSKVSTLNTTISRKMDDFSIEIYNGTGGNPKPVRFATFNYSTCVSEEGIAAKISLVSGHGNGTSYAFLEDAIIRVNYQGLVEVDNFKYYGQDCGTYDGEARQYGDIFWVVDTTNKVVDFYVLMGQYARVQQTPWKRLTYSSKGTVTQYSSCTVYSSGTKVYANNSEIATKSDIPEGQDLSVYAKKATTLSGYGITDAYTKTQVDTTVASLQSSIDGKAASSHSHSAATTSAAGFMSATDKAKLDGIAAGANAYSHPTTSGNKHIPSGGSSGQILRWSADGTAAWGADNNTTYSAGTGISLSGTTFSNSGVRSITSGSTNGTISVNTNGTSAEIAVKGLGSAAYTASSAYDAAGTAQTKADAALASAKSYADGIKSDLLNGAGTAYDTLKELGDLIDDNTDAIDALEAVAAGKASASHAHGNITNAGAIGTAANKAVITTTNGVLTTGTVPVASGGTGATTAANALKNLGLTATASELNTLDGITATVTELNYCDGVTSNIQTQLNGKQAAGNYATSGHTHSNYASTVTTTGTGNAITAISQSGNTITATKGSTFLTSLPSHNHDDRYYTEDEVDELLSGKQAAGSYASSSHTHNYAGSSSAGGAATSANKVNSNLVVKLNGGTTEGTNMFTFNGSGAKTINITPSSIGAQASGNYLTSLPSHNHDDRYYTEAEVDNLLSEKAGTSTATTSANGLMSSSDKSKLNGIAANAEVNQNAFSNVTVGSTTIAADAKSDTLTIAAGSNVTITPDATNDKITIAATNTTYNAATTSAAGLMSASDKSKLDGIATGANAYTLPTASSSTLGGVKTTSSVTSTSGLTACPIISGVPYYKDTTYSALRNPYALSIGLTGDGTSVLYDGSQLKSINITAASVGAAASNHNHNDVYYTETEIDTKISNLSSVIDTKASSSHVHDKLVISQSDNGTKISSVSLSSPTGGSANYLALQPHITDSSSFSGTLLGTTTNPFSRIYANAMSITGNADITGTLDVDRAVTLGTTLKTNGITTVLARIQPDLESTSGGVVNLGYSNANNRWSNIYSKTAVNTGSDLRIKKNISEIDDRYIKLFDLIQPYAYQFVDGTSGRYHTGFISQYVEEAMAQVGLEDTDVAFFCKDAQFKETKDEEGNVIGSEPVLDENGNQEYFYSLRYEEYIAIMTEKIKRMEKRIDELESKLDKVEELEVRLAKLEA